MHKISYKFLVFFLLSSCTYYDMDGYAFKSKNALYIYEEGILLCNQERIFEGHTKFKDALSIEPHNAAILNNLGRKSRILGDLEDSMGFYKQSLEVSDSTYSLAAINLSFLYFQLGDSGKGVDLATYVYDRENNYNLRAFALINRCLNFMDLGLCDVAKRDIDILNKDFLYFPNRAYQMEELESLVKDCYLMGQIGK